MYKKQLQGHLHEALKALEKGPLGADKLTNKAVSVQQVLKRIFPTNNNHQRWHALVQLFPAELMSYGNKIAILERDGNGGNDGNDDDEETQKETVTLTHAEASTMLRLSYSVTYSNIQGKTIRDKHMILLDTHHKHHFTTRHLIVGVSRATHGSYVHVPTPVEEDDFMRSLSR